MNPFDLRGPEFLVFYLLLMVATFLVLVLLRRNREAGPLPPQELNDPYLYAFLAGGPAVAVNAATMALVDRGALQMQKKTLTLADDPALQTTSSRIEKDVLDYFRGPFSSPRGLLTVAPGFSSCMDYDSRLRSQKLLPDAEMKQHRHWQTAAAILLLVGVSALKIFLAVQRGHKNVAFLFILTGISFFIALAIGNPRRTPRGNEYLRNARSLFSRLSKSARGKDKPAGADLLWAAALFGVATVPQVQYLRDLGMYTTNTSTSGDSGGGCGGGGCGGGGCGGCGG